MAKISAVVRSYENFALFNRLFFSYFFHLWNEEQTYRTSWCAVSSCHRSRPSILCEAWCQTADDRHSFLPYLLLLGIFHTHELRHLNSHWIIPILIPRRSPTVILVPIEFPWEWDSHGHFQLLYTSVVTCRRHYRYFLFFLAFLFTIFCSDASGSLNSSVVTLMNSC